MPNCIAFVRQSRRAWMRRVAGLCAAGGVFFCTFAQAQTPDFAHFAYDKSAPLELKQVSARTRGGVTIGTQPLSQFKAASAVPDSGKCGENPPLDFVRH